MNEFVGYLGAKKTAYTANFIFFSRLWLQLVSLCIGVNVGWHIDKTIDHRAMDYADG